MTSFLAASATDVAPFFIELGLILLGLALLGRIATHNGFSPIPLYLLAGLGIALVQPPDLGADIISIEAQIAVVLLLFMLGVEYSADELVSSLRAGSGAGAVDLVLNFSPGLLVGLLLGWGPLAALVLGGVTYISSSSIIAKLLDDLNRLGNRETPAVLSILVIEDLAMAVYLPMVAALLVGGGFLQGLGSVGIALAAVAGVLFVAVRLGDRLSRRLAHPSDEVVLLTVFGMLLVVGGVAERLQFSAGVGAFLVGIALSGPIAERARIVLSPLRDLFAAAFFVLFGLQIDVEAIPSVALVAVVVGVVTSATKYATGWWAARRAGCAPPGRVRAGAALIARGEFSVIIAGLAATAGLEPKLAPLAASYVLFTAVAGPLVTRLAGERKKARHRSQAA